MNCNDEIRKYWGERIAKLGVPVEITEPVKGECGTAVGMLLPVGDTIEEVEMEKRRPKAYEIKKYDPNCPACREFDRKILLAQIFDAEVDFNKFENEHDHE